MKKSTIFGFSVVAVTVGLLITSFIVNHSVPFGYDSRSDVTETYVIIPQGVINFENNLSFQPEEVTIIIGVNNTVRWINQDSTSVFINSNNQNWTQIQINPNESEFLMFVEAGIYEYFGHPWMNGKVIVLDQEQLSEKDVVMIQEHVDELYYKQIKRIDVNCKCQQEGGPCIQPLFEWENTTHYIDNNFCKFIEKPENCTGNMLSFINARSNIFNENAVSVVWRDTNDSIIEKPGFMECVNQLRNIYGK